MLLFGKKVGICKEVKVAIFKTIPMLDGMNKTIKI
jgi:hypothetical protein